MVIKILGRTYSVEFKKELSNDEEIGYTKFRTQEIAIKEDVHKELQRITLLHEIIHSILADYKETENEGMINTLALGMYQTLNENKELLTFLCLGEGTACD